MQSPQEYAPNSITNFTHDIHNSLDGANKAVDLRGDSNIATRLALGDLVALGVLSREFGVIHKARGDLPATLATLLVLLRGASLEGLAASVDGAAGGGQLIQGAGGVHVAVQEEVLVVADDADLVDALSCAANAFDGDDADLGGVHLAGGAEEGDGAGEDSGELHFGGIC